MNVRKRRAILAQVENTLTTEQWEAVLAKYKYRCAYCGSKKNVEMDHIIPVSKNGEHTIHNVIPACRSCNGHKCANPPPIPVQPVLL
jgi:5-methylcytosine-specific restriction endonuclease McrA